ncbi:hypothetical protein JXR93_13055 [bacterium]|nr:hypothetical protein [bacterium]
MRYTKEHIFEEIAPILSHELKISESDLVETLNLRDDLKISELLLKQAFMKIEEHFEFRFTQSSFNQINTLSDLLNYIERIV